MYVRYMPWMLRHPSEGSDIMQNMWQTDNCIFFMDSSFGFAIMKEEDSYRGVCIRGILNGSQAERSAWFIKQLLCADKVSLSVVSRSMLKILPAYTDQIRNALYQISGHTYQLTGIEPYSLYSLSFPGGKKVLLVRYISIFQLALYLPDPADEYCLALHSTCYDPVVLINGERTVLSNYLLEQGFYDLPETVCDYCFDVLEDSSDPYEEVVSERIF